MTVVLKDEGHNLGKRPCHKCGRLGTDYMCSKCWKELQGFSPREREEPPFTSTSSGRDIQNRKGPKEL